MQYGKSEFWEDKYNKNKEAFDWYQRLPGLKNILFPQNQPLITPESKILNVGCGNSKLSEELFDEGFQNIINIDIAKSCINNMQEKYQDKGPTFQYIQMDVKNMSQFENGSFDMVIDKGLLDSILCGDNSTANSQKALEEINRVLKSGGIYFCVSFGAPEDRLLFLDKEEFDWEISHQEVIKPEILQQVGENKDVHNYHFVYICAKNQRLDEAPQVEQEEEN